MTGLEIKELVDATIEETIDYTVAKNGINKGILEMGPIVDDQVSSTAYEAYTWYTLPATCSQVIEVNIDDNYNTTYVSYRVRGTKILFPDAGTYIIHYMRKPAIISAITEIPEMHPDYHSSLTIYLEGWYKWKEAIDDDEKVEGKTLMDNDFPAKWKQVQKNLTSKNQARFIPQR